MPPQLLNKQVMPSWDLNLLHLINGQWTHPVLDWLMPALSAINAWMPLIIVASALVAWRGGRRGRLMLLCIALAVGIGDGVISNTLKKTVGRVRPRDAIEGVVVRDLGPGEYNFFRLFKAPVIRMSAPQGQLVGNSFPSSHVVNMFAFATVVALFYRRQGIWAYTLAFAVAYSRIYVGAHWPTDVFPAMALGVLVGLTVVCGINQICHKRTAGRNQT